MNRELLIIALVVFVTSLFTRSVDPVVPLIADGLVVRVGGEVIDGSVAGRLDDLRRRLAG